MTKAQLKKKQADFHKKLGVLKKRANKLFSDLQKEVDGAKVNDIRKKIKSL